MTKEEAIRHITTWLYAAPGLPPMQVVQALELAANALRAGGKDKDVPTMPAGQPLTLEQLREMDGHEIKIVVIEENITLSGKVLAKREFVSGEDRCKYMFSSFGETWIAYAYPPAHISSVPMTNADRIRAMSDEELADQLVIKIDGLEEYSIYLSPPTGRLFVLRSEAVRVTLEWLDEPEED